MCGFSGVVFAGEQARDAYGPGLDGFRRAALRVAHRGDTDHRELIRERVWLSHFRLAFQDVAAGVQPMPSADGRHVIVFNGEVYNHLTLRPAITRKTGVAFRTRSDTETLIEGWLAFGDAFFERLEGEYAFVIVAADGGQLVAHRDRFGVKPLFLGVAGLEGQRFAHFAPGYDFTAATLELASEIKGIASPKSWDRDGLLRQLTGLFEPIRTPYAGVLQIPPGGTLTARLGADGFDCTLSTFPEPIRTRPAGTEPAAEADFEAALRTSVEDRLLSDVELGVYLSGGIDSKAIAFELSRARGAQAGLKSFTIGFTQAGYDETDEATAFARFLGFDPQVIRIDGPALDYSYPRAVYASELVQPFTNGAAKWWLSLFAREHVQGVLTGDGADEVLCGYPSFRYMSWWKHLIWKRIRRQPAGDQRRELVDLLETTPLGSLAVDSLYARRFAAHAENPWLAGASAEGTGDDFNASLDAFGVHHPLFVQIRTIAEGVLGPARADYWLRSQASSVQSWFAAGIDDGAAHLEDPWYALLLWQNYFVRCHLPVLILNWVGDRMEMANTLEGRTPFLSNHVRRLIQTQPDRALVLGLRDKVLLRRTYRRLLPARFVDTPKKQFNAPLLRSDRLIGEYGTEDIFERVGIPRARPLSILQAALDRTPETDSYHRAHLGSAIQTAIALSILQRTLIEGHEPRRDTALEARYLQA
jgi:asparagine synthase (glutamine-hydrolysing)